MQESRSPGAGFPGLCNLKLHFSQMQPFLSWFLFHLSLPVWWKCAVNCASLWPIRERACGKPTSWRTELKTWNTRTGWRLKPGESKRQRYHKQIAQILLTILGKKIACLKPNVLIGSESDLITGPSYNRILITVSSYNRIVSYHFKRSYILEC